MALEMEAQRINVEMARLGKSLVGRLFVLFKTSQNYSEGHQALRLPLENVIQVVREIQGKNEEASLRVRGSSLCLGDQRLKPDAAGFHTFSFVLNELARHGVGAICFNPPASADDLRKLVYTFKEITPREGSDTYTEFLERMHQRMIAGIEVEKLHEPAEEFRVDREDAQGHRLKNDRLKARLLYRQAMDAADRIMESAAAGKPLRLRESKRVVQQMIDLLGREESTLLGHATVRTQEFHPRSHPANVCILSLVVGRRLGMPKFSLCELGMAALFHDIGTAGMPGEIVDEQFGLSPEKLKELESHTLSGVRMMMQLKGLDALSARIITGVFEHHLMADYSGYPRLPYKRLGLVGRIISIADGYDTLTSLRARGRAPCSSEKAIRYLFALAGRAYDRALLKIFLGCIGLYPVGSLLQLDSRELAVVLGNHADPAQWCQPRIKIVADPAGREVEGEVLDLAQPSAPRAILGALAPQLHRIDVRRYLQQ